MQKEALIVIDKFKIQPINPLKMISVDLENSCVLYEGDIDFGDYVYKMKVKLTKDTKSKSSNCLAEYFNLAQDLDKLNHQVGETIVKEAMRTAGHYVHLLIIQFDDFINSVQLERNAQAAVTAMSALPAAEGRKKSTL